MLSSYTLSLSLSPSGGSCAGPRRYGQFASNMFVTLLMMLCINGHHNELAWWVSMMSLLDSVSGRVRERMKCRARGRSAVRCAGMALYNHRVGQG